MILDVNSSIISVVTPSFNQAKFLPKCLNSVSSQTYLPYEHIILDPGSSDGSVDIAKEYAAKYPFVNLCLEKDNGQVDGINKGLRKCNGDIVTWLNSDDYYYDNQVLKTIAEAFQLHPEIDVFYGRGIYVDSNGNKLKDAYVNRDSDNLHKTLQHQIGILQPALFFKRNLLDRIGYLDPFYNLSLDYEYWIRMAQHGVKFKFIDRYFAKAPIHDQSKTGSQRMKQFDEILTLVSSSYNYLPIQWIERYSACKVANKDGILSGAFDSTLKQEKLIETTIKNLLQEYNTKPDAHKMLLDNQSQKPYGKTYEAMKARKMIANFSDAKNIIVTSFDKNYFHQGLNLIAALHRNCLDIIEKILIFDLHLESHQIDLLNNLDKVTVVSYPDIVKSFFDGYLHPKNYSYKCSAIHFASDYAQEGDNILWMDSGVVPLKSLDEVFDIIQREGIFFVDHNDKESWPIYNITHTHPKCVELMKTTNSELLSPHLCSCLVGYRKSGQFQSLIQEAYNYSQIQDVVVWTKHPPDFEKTHPTLNSQETKLKEILEEEPLLSNTVPYERLKILFPYWGHRQDQTIYSILCARYSCKQYPANIYNLSNDGSSIASFKNWQCKSESQDVKKDRSRLNLDNVNSKVVVYHHRGIYNNLDGLSYIRKGDGRKIFVLGNGPSLKGIDLKQFKDVATVGMNAAYRYWEQIDWYPTYYCCMDLVVLESHKKAVKSLIDNMDKNGIKMFFLREKILKTYPELSKNAAVFILEKHIDDFSLLKLEPITTGSYSALYSVILGYSEIYLLGIDCNYVEFIDGVKRLQGNELELNETPQNNPNYFFEGYQQKGDRYNIPNPHPGLHIRSWAKLQKHIAHLPVQILNANRASKLKVFPFIDLKEALDDRQKEKRLWTLKNAAEKIIFNQNIDDWEEVFEQLAQASSSNKNIVDYARKFVSKTSQMVSVIIFEREYSMNLETTIKAITEQIYPNYEILIISNTYKDKTQKLANLYTEKVKYYPQKKQGILEAYNYGLQLAKGKITVFLTEDKIILKNKLVDLIDKYVNSSADIVLAGGQQIVNNKNTHLNLIEPWKILPDLDSLHIWNLSQIWTPVNNSFILFNTDVLKAVGGFNTKLDRNSSNIDLLLRLKLREYKNIWLKSSVYETTKNIAIDNLENKNKFEFFLNYFFNQVDLEYWILELRSLAYDNIKLVNSN